MNSTFALGLFIGIISLVGSEIYLRQLESPKKRSSKSKTRKANKE